LEADGSGRLQLFDFLKKKGGRIQGAGVGMMTRCMGEA